MRVGILDCATGLGPLMRNSNALRTPWGTRRAFFMAIYDLLPAVTKIAPSDGQERPPECEIDALAALFISHAGREEVGAMAQLHEENTASKVALLLRQRPAARVALLCVAAAVAVAVALGVSGGFGATGFSVARADAAQEKTSAEDAATNGDNASEAAPADKGSVQAEEGGSEAAQEVFVDVGGAVASPGLVRLTAGARVNDAVAAAGGMTSEADAAAVNLAAKLEDGQKVYVPAKGESSAPAGSPAAGGTGASGSGTGGSGSALVNINTATAEELDELPGVGPATAQAIIDERESNGAFTSIEDLMRVSGIGEKKFEKLASSICV